MKIKDTAMQLPNNSKTFQKDIYELCGENVFACYQCGKCTAGCPVAFAMDVAPNQVIRMIQLGLKDETLNSTAIWMCTGCETCASRCPCGVSLAKITDGCRQMAIRESIRPKNPEVLIMHEEILRQIKWHGRTHELGMMGMYKMRSRHFTEDIIKGIDMMIKGKLAIIPGRVKKPSSLKNLFGRDCDR